MKGLSALSIVIVCNPYIQDLAQFSPAQEESCWQLSSSEEMNTKIGFQCPVHIWGGIIPFNMIITKIVWEWKYLGLGWIKVPIVHRKEFSYWEKSLSYILVGWGAQELNLTTPALHQVVLGYHTWLFASSSRPQSKFVTLLGKYAHNF